MNNPENHKLKQDENSKESNETAYEAGKQFNIMFIMFIVFDVIALLVIVLFVTGGFSKKSYGKAQKSNTSVNLMASGVNLAAALQNEIQQENQKNSQQQFEQAVFLGDSLTEGLSLYNYVKTKNVVARKGLAIEQALKKVGKIAKKKPQTMYIMLGINDLNYASYSMDDIEQNYKKLLEKLHGKLPDTKIYVQSLLPVTAKFEKAHKRLSNRRIDKMNQRIERLADQYGYAVYVDVNQLYRNKKGVLPKKDSSDGYHLKAEKYEIWVDYLKNLSKNKLEEEE